MILTLFVAVEHPGGEGVANELFELGLDSFIVSNTPRQLILWANLKNYYDQTADFRPNRLSIFYHEFGVHVYLTYTYCLMISNMIMEVAESSKSDAL